MSVLGAIGAVATLRLLGFAATVFGVQTPAALAILAPLFANPPSLVGSDGDRHARLRAGANRAFPATPARVAADPALIALIDQGTGELAGALARRLADGPVDLAAAFAWPLKKRSASSTPAQ